MPGGSWGKTKTPSGLVWTLWATPWAELAAVTVAPGNAAPVESFTVPVIEPALWARAGPPPMSTIAAPAALRIEAWMACLTVPPLLSLFVVTPTLSPPPPGSQAPAAPGPEFPLMKRRGDRLPLRETPMRGGTYRVSSVRRRPTAATAVPRMLLYQA